MEEIKRNGKIPLRRPCKYCEKLFIPRGKFQKVCDVCLDKSKHQLKPRVKVSR